MTDPRGLGFRPSHREGLGRSPVLPGRSESNNGYVYQSAFNVSLWEINAVNLPDLSPSPTTASSIREPERMQRNVRRGIFRAHSRQHDHDDSRSAPARERLVDVGVVRIDGRTEHFFDCCRSSRLW